MKVPPFEMPLEEQRRQLDRIRARMSVAVIRAKNPFNIGSIIRTAHSYLVKEIFLVGTESYYRRASMGMEKYEHIVECPDEDAFLEAVAGRPLYSIERDHANTTVWQVEYPEDVVLLFGNENDGLSDKLIAASDEVLAIPMYGINHSFPVAVAAGMVLCEWSRRRDPRGGHQAPGMAPAAGKPRQP